MKVMIVDDDAITLDLIENILQTAGYETRTASDVRMGFSVYEDFRPDLVITDIEMPGMNGLELLSAIRNRGTETIILVVTGNGNKEYAIQALRSGANNYLYKPIDQNILLSLVANYSSLIEARLREKAVTRFITQSKLEVTLNNSNDLTYSIVEYLVAQAEGFLAPDDLPMLRMGLIELITNAIEHGNLGITYEMKSKALESLDGYTQLIAERMADPRYAQRCVTIKSQIDREGCEWIIRDEGEGFDWQAIPNEMDAETLYASHGRGIFISRLQFDRMEYNHKGNEVRVVKYVKQAQ